MNGGAVWMETRRVGRGMGVQAAAARLWQQAQGAAAALQVWRAWGAAARRGVQGRRRSVALLRRVAARRLRAAVRAWVRAGEAGRRRKTARGCGDLFASARVAGMLSRAFWTWVVEIRQ